MSPSFPPARASSHTQVKQHCSIEAGGTLLVLVLLLGDSLLSLEEGLSVLVELEVGHQAV